MFDGARIGVAGTPALFINGLVMPGAETYAEISAAIDRENAIHAAAAPAGNTANVAVSRPPTVVKK